MLKFIQNTKKTLGIELGIGESVMKYFNRKILFPLIGIICISIPVLLAIYQSTKQSLSETTSVLLTYANDVLYRADKTADQIYNGIAKLEANNKQNPCSSNNINLMRSLAISASNIQAIGYLQNNNLICSSLGVQYINWALGPVDFVTSTGISIRFNVKFPNSATFFIIVGKNNYAAVIHKETVIETALFNKDMSLGIFSLDNRRAYATRGIINPKWFKRLDNQYQATFLQGGYAIALMKSHKYELGTFAAIPFSYLNENTIKTALIFVPASGLAGLILTYLIIYWMRQQLSLVVAFKTALKRKEFYLVYQPVFDVKTNLCIGAEVLVRWKRESGELIPPNEFIPLAEKNGLIRPLTDLIIELVSKEAEGLFSNYPHFHLAINVSAEDLYSNDILTSLRTLMLKTNAGPGNLIIEATERQIINLNLLKQTLNAIHKLGIKVAIDDFGTGYSNLSYLETLELDYLKIDKSFVDAVGTESSTSQVILHIIEMAKALNLKIIAEGVESKKQAEFMRDKGVQFAQGWLYSKPLPLEQVLLLQQKEKNNIDRND